MLPIALNIIGPGMEEEYADALSAISDLRQALGPRPLTNDTPNGRVLLEIAWLEQEINRRRLPIPVDRSYGGTVYFLTGSGELNHVPGVDAKAEEAALQRLYLVLQGIGLLKPRHVPVVIAAIDDFVAEAHICWRDLTGAERANMDDFTQQAELIRTGRWPAYRPLGHRFTSVDSPNLDEIPGYFGKVQDVDASLFDGWRPIAARKPPLPAPVPGLAPQAPPLPDNLQNQIP